LLNVIASPDPDQSSPAWGLGQDFEMLIKNACIPISRYYPTPYRDKLFNDIVTDDVVFDLITKDDHAFAAIHKDKIYSKIDIDYKRNIWVDDFITLAQNHQYSKINIKTDTVFVLTTIACVFDRIFHTRDEFDLVFIYMQQSATLRAAKRAKKIWNTKRVIDQIDPHECRAVAEAHKGRSSY